jgi:hypothetical protein
MSILDWLVLLGGTYIVFKAGEIYGYWTFAKAKYLSNIEKSLDEDEPIVEIYKLHTEKINDILYLFNYDTKDFVCQSNTIEGLAKIANEYKNIKLAAVVHEEKIFLFHNGEVKEQ